LKVRAGPVFANAIAGLPFGVDGMLGPALHGRQRALREERYVQLPPATPVAERNGATDLAQLAAGVVEDAALTRMVGTLTGFSDDRLVRTLRFLREARFSGLVTHLFGVRAFLPETIGSGHSTALGALREALREELDRLFIKLRLPKYVMASRDVETPSLRAIIERVMLEAELARGIPAESPTASLELRGGFDPNELGELAERLRATPIAVAPPWAALARLLPDDPAPCGLYRALLIDRFDALAEADGAEFIDVLQHHNESELDAALDEMCAALQAIVA
jgi:hypothetical protein